MSSRSRRVVAWFTCAAALATASFAQADWPDFDRPLDRGGSIEVYLARVAQAGNDRHVISGDCMSACTLWLSHRNSCVTPSAVLWFHATQYRWARYTAANPWSVISYGGNEIMLAAYPPRVREVVRDWLLSPDFHTLTGLQLAALGVPLCRAE